MYSALALAAGGGAMFNSATWRTITTRKSDSFKDLLPKYKLIKPPNVESTTQMGGLFVLDGQKVGATAVG